MTTMPPPPPPISSLLATLFLFLVSSTILNDDYGGIIISVDASRAYPHGCLYRHPSYYTYDERDDISWFTGGQNHHHHHDGELTTTATTSLTSETVKEESEFTDYRFLPPASHPIRRSYHQYKLLRRLGAGKFSNVFEAVDILAAAAAMKKKRKKKIASIQDDATNNETTDTFSSDNEASITTSTSTTTIDPNTLVVLKCLKPISERKIRRELLVLTHCRDLPNLARLIGIVIPSSMDGDEKIMKKKNERDGEMEVEVMKKEEVGGGSRKDHHHRRQYHQEQQQQQQQQSNHHARKRRRNNHRMSRQLHHKQSPHQQQHRQQDIGSITTDAAPVDAASRQRGLSNNSNRGNHSSIKHHHGTTNTSSTKHNTFHQRNDAVKDVNNLSNKRNGNTSNTNNGNSSQHGEQVPALVLEHAGRTAQWFCHGSRPLPSSSSSATTTTTTTEGKDNRPTTHKPHHNKYSYQNHLTEYEIKYYLCHLLIALDGLHAAGIMHRDVKPRNTLINLSEVPVFSSAERRRRMRKGISATSALQSSTSFESSTAASATITLLQPQSLMLVDLGLADFYLPGKEFNVRVASRHYKSPELLIGYEYYDYAIDMWSVGCILAGLLFRTEPFFRGVDNEDQLGRIVNCLGTRDFLPYCRKCNVRLSSKARAAIGKYCSESSSLSSSSSSSEDAPISLTNSDIGRRKPWLSYLTSDCPLPSSEATDLLDKLLVYDHEQRWTAREALSHSFFDEVRDEVWSEVQERIIWESQDDRCKQDAALNR